MEKQLSTKRKVTLLQMSLEEAVECEDSQYLVSNPDGSFAMRSINKSIVAWIRKGCKEGADDKFIKSLTADERNEIVKLIQEYQRLGK